jgi:hypothetical protein
MRRLLAVLVFCCTLLGAAGVASAAETWHVTVRGNGYVYNHTYQVEVDPQTGDFTGTGYIDDDPPNWPETVSGNLTGDQLTFTSVYGVGGHTGYSYSFTATVDEDGTFVGDSVYGQDSIQGSMPPRTCDRVTLHLRLAADNTFYPHTYFLDVDPATDTFTGTGYIDDDPDYWPETVTGTFDGTNLSLTSLYGPGGNPMYTYGFEAVIQPDGSFVGDSARYGPGTVTGTATRECGGSRGEPREPVLVRQTWLVAVHHIGYVYNHTYEVEIDTATGRFTGTGFLDEEPEDQPETVSGTLRGTALDLTSVYVGGRQPGYSYSFSASVDTDGTFLGDWGFGAVIGSGVEPLD